MSIRKVSRFSRFMANFANASMRQVGKGLQESGYTTLKVSGNGTLSVSRKEIRSNKKFSEEADKARRIVLQCRKTTLIDH